jgi:hypothetical protein
MAADKEALAERDAEADREADAEAEAVTLAAMLRLDITEDIPSPGGSTPASACSGRDINWEASWSMLGACK